LTAVRYPHQYHCADRRGGDVDRRHLQRGGAKPVTFQVMEQAATTFADWPIPAE
jgi:hypothetical protein